MEINEFAKGYILEGDSRTGIVLTHGFTSSPSYMRFAAERLNKLGYTVVAPLLPGHGTKESDLREGNADLWKQTVLEAVQKLKDRGMEKVFCMGHSLGGVVSLLVAAEGACDGVITVAAPVKIYHYPRIKLFSMVRKNKYHTMNKPDGRKNMFRYYRADGKSVGNLLAAMKRAQTVLKDITIPAMVVYSKDDMTVRAVSGGIIYKGISSSRKEMVEISGNHHQCIVDSLDQYIDKIHKFIEENS